ncbi:helicase-related protein [Aureispira sp. CCB-E]|uniref:helicase-related protein n=1 Tax=Aureispira sp. CCB-E TaxID=3051121 RepID=UPI002868C0D3|nr:helicase-related protein [Aureispira sp. CCB-E]WMX16503.1 helicase-related protein [Aureispira sp. CCB-E]
MENIYVPGVRITVREEDFIINNVKNNLDDTFVLEVEGLSELVKGKKFIFDTNIDKDIRVINPINTKFIGDEDDGYRKTKLFLETQLRNSTGYSKKITIAHKAAFDTAQYQFEPTIKAFQLPRPRMLIADAVGLGKTVEVGIFLAEMIKRGKGKRIMVLALKSILGQFQQEIWNRFSIPLVRLDSHGIAKIKTELPANKNPFEYYDKTIISIDTLKNNAKFRHYIEKSRWDIIVIDECHTVANSTSQRGDLAQFLATRCESLVLTSATPHNGKKETFANLIKMIEPIAVAQDGEYSKEDVFPYYVRRFKQHIMDTKIRANFQERSIVPLHANLNADEEEFLEILQKIKFTALSEETNEPRSTDLFGKKLAKKKKRDLLFAISLFKSYMSSPLAALKSIERRIQKIEKLEELSDSVESNKKFLERLKDILNKILDQKTDSKYNAFKKQLKELRWSGKKKDDRLVVFTERIETIRYLKESLQRDFNVAAEVITEFHGGLSDIDQQLLIEDFGKEDSKIRLFITSDAGSQGVNLHYFCNHMFNYDIPWSLITLEQRNGRIDRYGQEKTPYIFYLIAVSDTEGLKTDLHIIENLTKKEDEVYKSLGDVGSVMQLYDAKKENEKVEEAIIKKDENFLEEEFSFDAMFGEETDVTESIIPENENPIQEEFSLYKNDSAYYHDLVEQLKTDDLIKDNDAVFEDEFYLEVKNNKELKRVLFDLPKEARPALNDIYRLTLSKLTVQEAIKDARKQKGEWAKFQMLYDLHPIAKYYMTKLEASIDKSVALAAKLSFLPTNTAWFVIHGQVANDIGQSLISEFFVLPIKFSGELFEKPITLTSFIKDYYTEKTWITNVVEKDVLKHLESLLPDVVEAANEWYMKQKQQLKEIEMENNLKSYKDKLKEWTDDSINQLILDFGDKSMSGFMRQKMEDKKQYIDLITKTSSQYFKDLTSLNKDAYLRVLAVFYNDNE